MSDATYLRKRLTANDLGTTGSHQAGLHIPKSLAEFFSALDGTALNPSVWLNVSANDGTEFRWRFVHYNNGIVKAGTRDEYRITYVRDYLRSVGATVGDVIELKRNENGKFDASVLSKGMEGDVLVLRTSGPWAMVRYRGPRGLR